VLKEHAEKVLSISDCQGKCTGVSGIDPDWDFWWSMRSLHGIAEKVGVGHVLKEL